MMDNIQVTFSNPLCQDNEMDDDWDPMRDEYENPNVNAYNHGPGIDLDVSLQRPAYRDKNNQVVYKITVARCPQGLSQNGLQNLLMNFGTPNISKMKGTSNQILWALIEFKTLKEAQSAIKALNSCPPYNLDVKFARSDEENNRLQREKIRNEAFYQQWNASQSQITTPNPASSPKPAMQNFNFFRMLGRQGRGRVILNATANLHERRPGNAWSQGIPDFADSGLMYNPNSRYESSNRHLQNIVISTGSDSMRRVSMGRGYVPPEDRTAIPSSTESPLKKSVGHDIYIPLQPCTNCDMETTLKCSQCGAPYCSRKCQKEDFQRHKPQCSLKESIDVVMDSSIQQSARMVPLSEADNSTQLLTNEPNMQINRFWGRPEKNAVSVLQRDKSVVVVVYAIESGNIYGQLSFDEMAAVTEKLVLTLPTELKEVSRDINFWPSVGSLVAVRCNSTVYRGYILSSPSVGKFCDYTVALCDIGLVKKIQSADVLPLPSAYQELPELGVTCNVVQAMSDVTESLREDQLNLEVISVSASHASAQFQTKNGDLSTVSLSAWVPSITNDLIPVHIRPPCQVVISAYHHQHAIYVRPMGREYQETLFNIMQKVAAIHVTSPPLGRAPYKGEMVACQFQKDGNFYRGIVQEEARDREYTVFFVDFGNLAAVSLKDMKALPEELKNIACMSVKVSLKGVSQGPLSKNAAQFLNLVIQRELNLKLECPNPNDGVVLTCPDNSSFNAQVNDLLVPDWKVAMSKEMEPHGGQVIMLEDIKVLSLMKGDLRSDIANVVVLNIMANGKMAVCPCPEDCPEVSHVLQTLTDQINEYCEALDCNLSYCPRLNEVCLAKYHKDGLWYRAVNAGTSAESQSCSVGFLDFGNTENVKFKDIRRIAPEFIDPPAIMSTCQIEGVPYQPSEDIVKRLQELVPTNKVCEIKILDTFSIGHFKVLIPEVSDQLKSEFNL